MRFRSFARAFHAERIKQRRTSFWATALIVFPLLNTVLPTTFSLMLSAPLEAKASVGIAQAVLMFWARFFLPLFAAMVSFALQTTEHNAGMWKHLNAMPTRGAPQILAKLAMGALAILLSSFALVPLTALMLAIGHLVRPDLTLATTWPTGQLATAWTLNVLAGIGMVAVMIAIANRARRNVVGFTLGAGAILAVLGNAALSLTGYTPWSVGWVWSYMLMGEPAATKGIALLIVTTPLWVVVTLLIQFRLQKTRPLY